MAALALSPDGELIATGGADRVARLREAGPAGSSHRSSATELRITGAAFSPDGLLLATSSADQDVRLWHVETGRPAARVPPCTRRDRQRRGVQPRRALAVSRRARSRPLLSGSTDTEDFLGTPRPPEAGKLVGAAFYGRRDAHRDGVDRRHRPQLPLRDLLRRTDGLLASRAALGSPRPGGR